MKKATLTLLMSVTFLYFAHANKQSMTNVKKSGHYIHGDTVSGKHSKEYTAWVSIRKRCYNTECDKYEFYGGRGIKVCDRWKSSFPNFLADMGRAPSPKHSIDRINNNGNYEPSNCRWATHTFQCNNRRSTVILEHDGLSMSIKQWARYKGINYGTLYSRLYREKWTLEHALNGK